MTLQPDESPARAAMVDLAELVQSVNRIITGLERYEVELPQVLICTDMMTGEQSFSGPFRSPNEAERLMQHERWSAGRDSSLRFSVAPLYPVFEPGGPQLDPPTSLVANGHPWRSHQDG